MLSKIARSLRVALCLGFTGLSFSAAPRASANPLVDQHARALATEVSVRGKDSATNGLCSLSDPERPLTPVRYRRPAAGVPYC